MTRLYFSHLAIKETVCASHIGQSNALIKILQYSLSPPPQVLSLEAFQNLTMYHLIRGVINLSIKILFSEFKSPRLLALIGA